MIIACLATELQANPELITETLERVNIATELDAGGLAAALLSHVIGDPPLVAEALKDPDLTSEVIALALSSQAEPDPDLSTEAAGANLDTEAESGAVDLQTEAEPGTNLETEATGGTVDLSTEMQGDDCDDDG